MPEREGRSVLLYILLDVPADDEARELADELGRALGEADERFVGYAVGSVEPVQLTFDDSIGTRSADEPRPRPRQRRP